MNRFAVLNTLRVAVVRCAGLRRALHATTVTTRTTTNDDKDKTPAVNAQDEEHVSLINQHQESYFGNVRASFERVQAGRVGETRDQKRARLLYQSRKRGTLENGLLLANFAATHLAQLDDELLDEYDTLINNLHNEWDLYYWLTGNQSASTVPDELKSSRILARLKIFCANESKQSRIVQPPI